MPIPGAVVGFPCSYVFAAIGQDTDLSALDKEPENGKPSASRWATINTENATMETNVKGGFAKCLEDVSYLLLVKEVIEYAGMQGIL